MTNQFRGLARGPIDHNASAVINSIASGAITMGSLVKLDTTIPTAEILPRVIETANSTTEVGYGIAVGGDTDGIYGDGNDADGDALAQATAGAGQGVVVVTQGRCLARVDGTTDVAIGDKLSSSDIGTDTGVLKKAVSGGTVIATALQDSTENESNIIAVDVQREGVLA